MPEKTKKKPKEKPTPETTINGKRLRKLYRGLSRVFVDGKIKEDETVNFSFTDNNDYVTVRCEFPDREPTEAVSFSI